MQFQGFLIWVISYEVLACCVMSWRHGMTSLCHMTSPNDVIQARGLWNVRRKRCVITGAFSFYVYLNSPFLILNILLRARGKGSLDSRAKADDGGPVKSFGSPFSAVTRASNLLSYPRFQQGLNYNVLSPMVAKSHGEMIEFQPTNIEAKLSWTMTICLLYGQKKNDEIWRIKNL